MIILYLAQSETLAILLNIWLDFATFQSSLLVGHTGMSTKGMLHSRNLEELS